MYRGLGLGMGVAEGAIPCPCEVITISDGRSLPDT